MAFWNRKRTDDPVKQFKKLKKYCIQVLGLSKEEAEEKAREWLESRGKDLSELDK